MREQEHQGMSTATSILREELEDWSESYDVSNIYHAGKEAGAFHAVRILNNIDGEWVRRQDILDLIEDRLQHWGDVRDSISNEQLQEEDAAQAKFNQARERRKELKQLYEEVQQPE